eukprot:TRINITY_DN15032_c0_g1_i1.p1 TRINITY_DN15032_c0_g1~~TRINITY_DN15032_c0_g1_i1.p1  ORF type:complete len:203 (+),score=25.41 TRINITY_DN15032_c0_g1_i1:286-894(+)
MVTTRRSSTGASREIAAAARGRPTASISGRNDTPRRSAMKQGATSSTSTSAPSAATATTASTAPDAEELILPKPFNQRILVIAHFIWVSFGVAFMHELYDCAIMAILVYLTSINYWRHPVRGWRRNLDMTFATLALTHHMTLGYIHGAPMEYAIAIGLAMLCYLLARQQECKDRASALHCCLHLFGNVSNVVLYLHLATMTT